MKKFKERLKLERNIYLVAFIILIILTVILIQKNIVVVESTNSDDNLLEFVLGVRLGVVIGCIFNVLFLLVRAHYTLTNKERLEKCYVKVNDERRKHIMQNVESMTMKLLFLVLVIALIIATFLNTVVAITIISVLALIRIIYGITYFYYKFKF